MEPLLKVASAAYGAAVRANGWAYDSGWRRVVEVEGVRVVSVGGVRAGGDGKTPLALHCALELQRRGLSVAILCRGYRGSWERVGGVVTDGGGSTQATVEEAGDEAVMLARRVQGIAVVVGADRVKAAERARALGATVVVLDSGFQHRRLARHLDIATVSLPLSPQEALLPLGSLREPLSGLARADVVGYELTVPSSTSPQPPPLARSFTFRLRPEGLLARGGGEAGGLSALAGVRALLVVGIARPGRFERVAGCLGIVPTRTLVFPDHHVYSASDRRLIVEATRATGAELVLTTEKDLVRLASLDGPELWALRVAVVIEQGAELLGQALRNVALNSIDSARQRSDRGGRREGGWT